MFRNKIRKLTIISILTVFFAMSGGTAPAMAKVSQAVGYNQKLQCLNQQYWWRNPNGSYNNPVQAYGRAEAHYNNKTKFPTVKPTKAPPNHKLPSPWYGEGDFGKIKAKNYVLVDKARNHLWVYSSGRIIKSIPTVDNNRITPGNDFWDDYTGGKVVYANRCDPNNGGILRNFIGLDDGQNGTRYSNGKMYYSGIGVHAVPLSSSTKVYGNTTYDPALLGRGVRESAGCINVSFENSKFLYDFLLVGTPVVIINSPSFVKGKY
jgi:hypothetical protein